MEVEHEPVEETPPLMDDEQFEQEVELAGQGDWAALDLDELPADWRAATIEDLRGDA